MVRNTHRACLLLFVLFSTAHVLAAEQTSDPLPEDASADYSLEYKFAMGEELRFRVSHVSNVRTTIDGTTQQVESQSESVKVWKVTDVLPGGEMEFVHIVESVKMSNRSPGRGENRFDSESEEPPPPGFATAAQAVGVPLSVIRIAETGEVVERKRKHPQPPASEDMPITLVLPEHSVAVGDKWDAVYDVSAKRKNDAAISVRTRRLCRLRSVKSGIAIIDVDYQILTPVDSFVRSQLVERLTKGTVRFDIKRGRVIAQEHAVDRRILGFAGGTSSMHFVARLRERLISESESMAKSTALAR